MPPRIRTRALKAQKENIGSENKLKTQKNNTKVERPRRALADKTNSASDDASPEGLRKAKNSSPKYDSPAKNKKPETSPFITPLKVDTSLVASRSRRICRLPSRFADYTISPNKYIQPENASTPIQQKKDKTNDNNTKTRSIRAKTTTDDNDTETRSIRAKTTTDDNDTKTRSIRAKTRTDDNDTKTRSVRAKTTTDDNDTKTRSVKAKITTNNNNTKTRSTRAKITSPKLNNNTIIQYLNKPKSPKVLLTKLSLIATNNKSLKVLDDAKQIQEHVNISKSPKVLLTKLSPKVTINKKPRDKNSSWKVLGDKKKTLKQNENKNASDIYEFTFDPDEEPQPQKKKRKKPATKKPRVGTKPKPVTAYKSTYDQNIQRAITALKKVVNPSKAEPAKLPQIKKKSDKLVQNEPNHVVTENVIVSNMDNYVATLNDTGKTSVHECNYPSIRVEDIAADIEPSVDNYDDINYSPVSSPGPKSPVASNSNLAPIECPVRPLPCNDPLNLQEELSFFDDEPVASSSMNISVRHPLASPWRVEFGSLPIKWHSNTYVKPNMTPAVESSFICSEDSNKKKHVYTCMVPESNELLPPIVSNTSNLKQLSIISFIKEVAEKKARKKRGRSVSPSKASTFFDNIDVNINTIERTGNESNTTTKSKDPALNNNSSNEVTTSSSDISNDKVNSKEKRQTRGLKRKNNENVCELPAKSPRKQKDKDCTYFGFDDSENQENELPAKVKSAAKGRSLRSRLGKVLQEINGPTRAALPVAVKSKTATSSEAVNKVYEELKAGEEVPVFPENNVEVNVTNVEDSSFNDDEQSVHLFEDIEVVHHMKPTRKSYGKAKKVTFRKRSTSASETEDGVAHHNNSSFEDDFGDLTFEVPNIKEKKAKKKKSKKLMSKKEEKEAEEWAAGFNSMCEEIEEFPLIVE